MNEMGRKAIHWELCKKLKFDQITKWYIYRPEPFLKNKMHKIFWYLRF